VGGLHTAVVQEELHIGLVVAHLLGKPGTPAGRARYDQFVFVHHMYLVADVRKVDFQAWEAAVRFPAAWHKTQLPLHPPRPFSMRAAEE
jgi:hypothetical protein